VERSKIDRINELAKKSKTSGLSQEEKAEQQTLRNEYIQACRNDLRATLDSVKVIKPQ
jgi:uncharacterized protein YnzC (UPF0291/DUF896 family)